MFRKLFTLIGTLGIVAIGIVIIAAMGAARPKIERSEPNLAPPTVFYKAVQPEAVTLDVYAQGEVRPRTDINLIAQVSGRIVSTSPAFADGGAFKKGELLLKIEDADYRIAATSAKAQVAQAAEALRREEAESELAERDAKDLGLDDPSELTLRMPQLAQARANYEAAEAQFRAAQLNLDRTAIEAPFDGRVRTRDVGEGQWVGVGSQLGRIFSTDAAEIKLSLTDGDLAKLGLPISFVETKEQPGPAVVLSGELAGREHRWTGRIARADGAIDPQTRQVTVIAVVDDPYGAAADNGAPLAMGLFVTAKIEGRPFEGAYILPRSALYGRDTVYVIAADDKLVQRTVDIVSAERDVIIVASGLEPGDRVATSPLRGADVGDVVTPEDPSNVGDDTPEEVEPAPKSNLATSVANGGVQ